MNAQIAEQQVTADMFGTIAPLAQKGTDKLFED